MALTAKTPKTLQSTFLIPSIHCPTCASFLNDFLFSLRPKPIAVDTSIVSHSLTVQHPASLSPRAIAKALGEAGYEVDTLIKDPAIGELPQYTPRSSADDDFPIRWPAFISNWLNGTRKVSDRDTLRRHHAEHCQQCRQQEHDTTPPTGDEALSIDPKPPNSLVVIDSVAPKSFRASITINGMSCSSCVGKITSTLQEIPWVRSANVALLTQSAIVEYDGEHDPSSLIEAIEDSGYQANIHQIEETTRKPAAHASSGPWKLSLAIGGMTCSSCVGSITSSLESLPFIREVDVNLVTSSATATLNDAEELGGRPEESSHRTVMIRVDGVYCEHCPARIREALATFGDRVVIEGVSTPEDSITTISYLPSPPDFTIRQILAAIAAADSEFHPEIYHLPTVEERAREMHHQIRQHILFRVILSVIIAIPSFIIGIVYMALIPDDNTSKMYLMERLHGVTRAEWSLFVMATPIYFFAADIFHRRMMKELYSLWRPSSPVPLLRRFYKFGSMDLLMSFGTTIAYFGSIAEIIIAASQSDKENMMQKNMTYFDSVVFLTMFLLIGRLLEAWSKAKTGEAVSELGNLRPKQALLLTSTEKDDEGEDYESVSIDLVETGAVVRVIHGGSPPWDGVLLSQEAEFSEASLTGESRPVRKTSGDEIFSGTVNNGGPISMRITGASGNSMLNQIIKVVREGQARRAPIERIADTLTSYFVPVVTLIAVATWLVWLSLGLSGRLPGDYLDAPVGGWPFWSLQFAIAVLIVACPCGIGLAAPTALFVGGGLAAKYGILAKGGGEAFQEASNIDIIVFDKTGTLTEGGEPRLTDHEFLPSSSDGWKEKVVLACLNEIESNSSHPIAKATVAFCEDRGAKRTRSLNIKEVPGKGMTATFDLGSKLSTIEMLVGNERLMEDFAVSIAPTTLETLNKWKDEAKSIVLVAGRSLYSPEPTAWRMLAIFAAADPLRPETKSVLTALRRQGKDIWMLSGDNQKTANAVGALVGIDPDHIIAGVLPEQKADKISYLQKSQARPSPRFSPFAKGTTKSRAIVAMVGDGVNDSPALTMADVGIAIGSGSDVAISAAEFVLVNANLNTLLILTSLSRAVFRRVKFNFAWALVYNLVALPIAAGVLYPVVVNGSHTRLDPVWASSAMALSSVSVICSSLFLKSRLPFIGFRTSKALEESI
ncbi:heavy metal translocatin [Hypoxylon trugodes]|uniref:heavy metal translocatin n=1 Tax=Hypoxylon trugodes TaxID=326681 RepID=UPI0021A0B0E2|nr:heavy metal translocatin [Hypoxylon trugodes]KAI1390761.1 heavy metal translocatin [Hypoxylon trugodes]